MSMVMVIADACCFPDLLGCDRCLLVVWKEEDAGVRSLLATGKRDGAGSGELGRFGVVSGGLGVQNRKGSYLVGWVAAAEGLLGCWKFWMDGPNMVF
ncbi:hypothetical protein KY290_011586 [Solanum tuberosum]|uniref:Uncharacterized protein n=1 Tax=Solanum tuberosum TaxID=4113 RepID=A0ABQ7W383_SOLTU|nr:hypothetical protein KY290_011586 [Solanum tuberosum]